MLKTCLYVLGDNSNAVAEVVVLVNQDIPDLMMVEGIV